MKLDDKHIPLIEVVAQAVCPNTSPHCTLHGKACVGVAECGFHEGARKAIIAINDATAKSRANARNSALSLIDSLFPATA